MPVFKYVFKKMNFFYLKKMFLPVCYELLYAFYYQIVHSESLQECVSFVKIG